MAVDTREFDHRAVLRDAFDGESLLRKFLNAFRERGVGLPCEAYLRPFPDAVQYETLLCLQIEVVLYRLDTLNQLLERVLRHALRCVFVVTVVRVVVAAYDTWQGVNPFLRVVRDHVLLQFLFGSQIETLYY